MNTNHPSNRHQQPPSQRIHTLNIQWTHSVSPSTPQLATVPRKKLQMPVPAQTNKLHHLKCQACSTHLRMLVLLLCEHPPTSPATTNVGYVRSLQHRASPTLPHVCNTHCQQQIRLLQRLATRGGTRRSRSLTNSACARRGRRRSTRNNWDSILTEPSDANCECCACCCPQM